MYLHNILPFAHTLLRTRLQAGDAALDGTMGNGHDTLLLAQAVGTSGKVWAFDVQEQAVSQTRQRLQAHHASGQVELILDSHEHLALYVSRPLAAAVFNFGWLPGGNKNCTTQAKSSICALSAALELLADQGLLLAVLYPGHEAGAEEALLIEAWAAALSQQQFAVLKYGFVNRKNNPPYLLAIERLS